MKKNIVLIVLICFLQIAYSQYLGPLGPGYSPALGPILSPYPGPALIPECAAYGGAGIGDVAVVGELPVVGSTLIAGQVPVIGSVRFAGDLPAAGILAVSGGCACGCGAPGPFYY